MNDVEKINSCSLVNKEIVSKCLNTFFNVLGIMFFVSFMGYVALHFI